MMMMMMMMMILRMKCITCVKNTNMYNSLKSLLVPSPCLVECRMGNANGPPLEHHENFEVIDTKN